MRKFLFLMALLAVTGCGEETPPDKKLDLVLAPASFADLPGWGGDDWKDFAPAFEKSCARIALKPASDGFGALPQGGTYSDWKAICQKFVQQKPQDIKTFFEQNFTPYQVKAGNDPQGLFTGYYEASLRGSRTRKDLYTIPLHWRPYDLVMVDLGTFREELKGQRIAGRVVDGNLRPYESRAEIVAGDWPNGDQVLVWVDNPVDAFFVQIQGSGIVTLDDGSSMRIGYAGQNGHPYTAIGRELIKRGEMTKENVSMQSIRAWLAAHPAQAEEIMNTNKSYVFFREHEGEGPLGAQGVALTSLRSLAVDRTVIPYGLPLWVDIEHPAPDTPPLQRLMIAQDTGGAIIGAVRGDVFWGYGQEAELMAGRMKSKGRYWALLPRIVQ